MGIEPIDLRLVDDCTANIYEAIIVSGKRARQINDETKIEFNMQTSNIQSEVTDDENEDIENPAQLKVSLEFEAREKPHIQALNELLVKKIDYRYKDSQ